MNDQILNQISFQAMCCAILPHHRNHIVFQARLFQRRWCHIPIRVSVIWWGICLNKLIIIHIANSATEEEFTHAAEKMVMPCAVQYAWSIWLTQVDAVRTYLHEGYCCRYVLVILSHTYVIIAIVVFFWSCVRELSEMTVYHFASKLLFRESSRLNESVKTIVFMVSAK